MEQSRTDPPVTDISLECAGRRLAARLTDGSHGDGAGAPAIMFLHGLHSDQSGYAARARAAASQLGAVCLTFDLGGHGDSEGVRERLSARDHLRDARCAYDALAASAPCDPDRIGVCGASYGGYLAALLIAERPLQRVLLRAPALYPDEWLDVPLRERATLADPPVGSIVLNNLAAFAGEALVVESGHDAVIPRATIEAYLQASPRVHHALIAQATHHLADSAWNAEFVRLIIDWFRAL